MRVSKIYVDLKKIIFFQHKSDRTTFSMLAEYDMDLRTADAPRMIYLNYLVWFY